LRMMRPSLAAILAAGLFPSAGGTLAQPAAPAAPALLAPVFGDHAVLQRGSPIPIWGRAQPVEMVTVAFAGTEAQAKADPSGQWRLRLNAQAAGGPYDLTARA